MEDRLIQPIVLLIDKNNPAHHLDAIEAVARASVISYARNRSQSDQEVWELWLARGYGKTVRRASLKAFLKVSETLRGTRVSCGTTRALAFPPTTYPAMPKELASLQVSGTDLPRGKVSPATQTQVVLNASLGMSTGKAAAQAAHALFGWFLSLDPVARGHQLALGIQASAIEVNTEEFNELSRRAAAPVIVDSGFTEIAPNTATAFILRSQP